MFHSESVPVHRSHFLILAGVLACAAGSARPIEAQVTAADSTFFVRVTQQMLDAVTSGDTTVWARYLAPEWVETDEEGRYISRTDQLAAMHPLPAGQHGSLTLDRWKFMAEGGTVVMTYDADEVHDFYGQRLITVFHSTDTWVKRRGRWRQIATQQTALPRPVTGEPTPSAEVAADTGTYVLPPVLRMQVAADDSGLTVARGGAAPQRLYQLTRGIFIRHGMRGFWVFEPGADGRVARLVWWRDNNRVAFDRIP